MPHTPELLNRLTEALAIADAANDYLVGAYIAEPIALLQERLSKPPQKSTLPK